MSYIDYTIIKKLQDKFGLKFEDVETFGLFDDKVLIRTPIDSVESYLRVANYIECYPKSTILAEERDGIAIQYCVLIGNWSFSFGTDYIEARVIDNIEKGIEICRQYLLHDNNI